MDKPNTLQEAVLSLENLQNKISSLSAELESAESENVKLKNENGELSSEIFGLKSSVESEQNANAELRSKLSELQKRYDILAAKDADVEERASQIAAKIAGESGAETPVEVSQGGNEPSVSEISEMLSKASGREKAVLMDKYGDRIFEYLRRNK